MEVIKGVLYAILGKGKAIMKAAYETLTCKFYGSGNIVPFGMFRGIQCFRCKDCKRKFADNEATAKDENAYRPSGLCLEYLLR